MGAQPIDYAALAAQARAQAAPAAGKVDYAALAAQARAGASAPASPPPVVGSPSSWSDKLFGAHPVSDIASSVGTHLKNLVTGPIHAFIDPLTDREKQDDHGDGMLDSHILRGAYRMTLEPTVQALEDSAALRKAGGPRSSLTAASTYDASGRNLPTAGSKLIDAIPLVGPYARALEDESHQKGFLPAAAGFATDLMAPHYAMKLPGAVAAIPDAVRGGLTSGADVVLPGTADLTPRARFEAAKNLGVRLDAADATGNSTLGLVKKVNRDSALGSPVYDRAAADNTAALRNATDETLQGMSPHEPEIGGKIIQQRLQEDHAGLRNDAEEGFRWLDEATGGAPVPGASEVGKQARTILDQQAPFYTKYPSFRPGNALSALADLSKVGDTASYAELQRLRSNTHELTTTNPDLVKDQSTGWLQRMTGTLDDAITDNGLTPAQAEVFRAANENWSVLKDRYDNPQSPLFDAVRTPNASKLSSGIGSKTPEMLADLAPRIAPDGLGALRRGVATDALGSTKTGDYNFGNFGRKLYGMPDAYRQGLFSPEQSARLEDIAKTGNVLGTDFNPSGSAKQGQKVAEFGAAGASAIPLVTGNPLPALGAGIYHGLQYGAARLLNSPKFVDWLMKDGAPPASSGGLSNDIVMPGAVPRGLDAPALVPPPRYSDRVVTPADAGRGVNEVKLPVTVPAEVGDGPRARLAGIDGSDTQLHTPTASMPAKYRVVEADSLTPSHNATNFIPNRDYPAGVQERDYAGQKENQLRVITNARNYKPELTVTDNPDGVNGPPVVTPDGIVLGGNSRVMSTQRLYGEGGDAYKDYLKSKAASFGLDPEAINAMKKPVLVREVAPQGGVEGMRRLGSDLNKSMTGAMGGSERAVSLGKSISPDTLHSVRSMLDEVGPDATLREVLSDPARSNNFLQRMQRDGIITPAERPQFVDTATGGMTEEGKRLFERSLLGAAIGDSAAMDAAPKHILQKLTGSIGPLSGLLSRSDEWNILPATRRAVAEHGKMASSGIGVEDYLRQKSLLDKPMSPLEQHMVRVLAQNPNAVREAFSTYAKDAQYAAPGQATFLGPAPHQAFNHAFGGQLTPEDFGQR